MTQLSRKKYRIALSLLLAVLSSIKVASADDSVASKPQRIGSGNPVAGKEKARARNCFECHGEDGISTASGYPHLSGQYAEYIVKQLRNFRTGERKSPFMNNIAANLDDGDLSDIAAYFASKERTKGTGIQDNPVAKNLFMNGDKGRNILACISCHGENGQGAISNGVISPVISGQNMFYLREQLLNWNLGTRTNSPDRIMNKIADSLSEGEMEALARYISGM